MDATVDVLSAAFDDFIAFAAATLDARQSPGADPNVALEVFKQRLELFHVACDQAEEAVDFLRQRIASECLVDEATASTPPAQSGAIPPVSAVRLEQMSKAVRWLVIELQAHAAPVAAPAEESAASASAQ